MADKPPVALEDRGESDDGRRYSPSAARNRDPILSVLKALLPEKAIVLEIASGTGEHGAWFTQHLPGLDWTYSDIDPESLASQRAWRAADGHGRLRGPLAVDASAEDWDAAERPGTWQAIYSANMVHIAPFAAAEGLFRGAGRLLAPGGALILYGPFARHGEIAPSNAAFSESLKARNPDWGVRDLDAELAPLANASGLALQEAREMPANNLIVVFRRAQPFGNY
jgi:SAM-dependent methyltransferase